VTVSVGSAGAVGSSDGEAGSDCPDEGSEDDGDGDSSSSGSGDGEADSETGDGDGDGSEPAVSPEADQAEDGTSNTSNTQQIEHATILPISRSTVVPILDVLDGRNDDAKRNVMHEAVNEPTRAGNTHRVPRNRGDQ
jgi:hypothetical protein